MDPLSSLAPYHLVIEGGLQTRVCHLESLAVGIWAGAAESSGEHGNALVMSHFSSLAVGIFGLFASGSPGGDNVVLEGR